MLRISEQALTFDDQLGSIEVGKRPGLLVMNGLEGQTPQEFKIGMTTKVTRLV